MSHRNALALSIALTLLLAVGVIAARNRLFAAPATTTISDVSLAPAATSAGMPAAERPRSLTDVDWSTGLATTAGDVEQAPLDRSRAGDDGDDDRGRGGRDGDDDDAEEWDDD